MESSTSMFSMRELREDKWFVRSLLGSIACAGVILTVIAVWNYSSKIPVRPIVDVVRLDDAAKDGSFEVKPISEITSDQKKPTKAVAWTGWTISLRDLCRTKGGAFSKGFSEAFQNRTAKLVIPAAEGVGWTIANADLSAHNCAQVKDNDSSQGIYAIFDAKIPSIAGRQVKAVFVPKGGEEDARPIP
jgi:hypothetical protein